MRGAGIGYGGPKPFGVKPMVFKKHLTPLSKHGRVIKHQGKGSTMQRPSPGQREDVTGGDPLDRAMNRYPATPQPVAPPTSAPPLGGPAFARHRRPDPARGPPPDEIPREHHHQGSDRPGALFRNASPQAYDKFFAAFADYAAQMTDNLIQTTENLQVAQGHAQLAMKVLRALEAART